MTEAIREARKPMTRWEAQQQQAKRQGFKNAWAMRKAAASKKRAAERALYGKIKQPATVTSSMNSSASWISPLETNRLQQGNGPIRQLMRDGQWLVPETERPQLKPIESVAGNAQAPVRPHSQQTKPVLSPAYQRSARD